MNDEMTDRLGSITTAFAQAQVSGDYKVLYELVDLETRKYIPVPEKVHAETVRPPLCDLGDLGVNSTVAKSSRLRRKATVQVKVNLPNQADSLIMLHLILEQGEWKVALAESVRRMGGEMLGCRLTQEVLVKLVRQNMCLLK